MSLQGILNPILKEVSFAVTALLAIFFFCDWFWYFEPESSTLHFVAAPRPIFVCRR